ncbi:hypothetical protein IPZ58_12210 [Streptomyces roseoverticillatus]|uniref:hypothetical protein n=1 Tax=Streptomyces roseoverticillatus TaxID=66429 RepID=UPI001F1ED876|nr:hypothetical protein [Streptomyces roseoverticillatus]MCF3102344.1 hypothetical protein [Streptomyces roseoverticillatus]
MRPCLHEALLLDAPRISASGMALPRHRRLGTRDPIVQRRRHTFVEQRLIPARPTLLRVLFCLLGARGRSGRGPDTAERWRRAWRLVQGRD